MDIGGFDLVLDTSLSPKEQREFALAYLRNLWPAGVIEEDIEDTFFYYKDKNSEILWNHYGDANVSHNMVYVLCGEGHITLVHEGLDNAEVKNCLKQYEGLKWN